MLQLNNRFRDYTFVLLITISSAFVAACGGGSGDDGGGGDGGDSVQVGSGTRTIDELTGDTFVTPEPIFASGTSKLGDSLRYYPWDNDSQYGGFIYRPGGTSLYYRESAVGEGYNDFNEEYRLVGRNEDAFPTDIASNALAFSGYDEWEEGDTDLDDADLFALEGEYAAAIGWYNSSDGLRGTVGLATPTTSLPTTGSAVWRGKALGGFVVGEPMDRTNQYTRVLQDANGVRGGDGTRYFVEGDIFIRADFSFDYVSGETILRAYEEPDIGRGYLNHFIGAGDGTAPADTDVAGSLSMGFEGDGISRHGQYHGDVTYLYEQDSGVFSQLDGESGEGRLMRNWFEGGFYGPNFEETAGDIRVSACSETPTYSSEGNFERCDGDLHYLGVGFVAQDTQLPLSTTPVPTQGDTKTAALSKLSLTETDIVSTGVGTFTITDYDNLLGDMLIISYEYASFGRWNRWVADASGNLLTQGSLLAFTDNQVSTLPTTGTATYDDLYVWIRESTNNSFGLGDISTSSSLTADFGNNEITGMLSIDSGDDDITMTLTDGSIASDATFSGDLTVSGTSGEFAKINTGQNGQFAGAFHDNPATYDASAAPDEVSGTFNQMMDSDGNEWTGVFIGD